MRFISTSIRSWTRRICRVQQVCINTRLRIRCHSDHATGAHSLRSATHAIAHIRPSHSNGPTTARRGEEDRWSAHRRSIKWKTRFDGNRRHLQVSSLAGCSCRGHAIRTVHNFFPPRWARGDTVYQSAIMRAIHTCTLPLRNSTHVITLVPRPKFSCRARPADIDQERWMLAQPSAKVACFLLSLLISEIRQ
jgi:hypothetical protein